LLAQRIRSYYDGAVEREVHHVENDLQNSGDTSRCRAGAGSRHTGVRAEGEEDSTKSAECHEGRHECQGEKAIADALSHRQDGEDSEAEACQDKPSDPKGSGEPGRGCEVTFGENGNRIPKPGDDR
jgi:hypothetical protein